MNLYKIIFFNFVCFSFGFHTNLMAQSDSTKVASDSSQQVTWESVSLLAEKVAKGHEDMATITALDNILSNWEERTQDPTKAHKIKQAVIKSINKLSNTKLRTAYTEYLKSIGERKMANQLIEMEKLKKQNDDN